MTFEWLKTWFGKFTKGPYLPKNRNVNDLWSELINTDLIDGTFVEYAPAKEYGYGAVEDKRGKVKYMAIGSGLNISLAGDKGVSYFLLRKMLTGIEKKDKMFYVDIAQHNTRISILTLALAPAGIKIPKRPSLEKISKEHSKR